MTVSSARATFAPPAGACSTPVRACLRALLAATLVLLGAVSASAQAIDRDQVAAALQDTDRRIAEAEPVLRESADPSAAFELSTARDLEARATQAAAAGRLEGAMRLTLEARRHADRAIAIARGLPDPDRVLAQLDRTRDMLDRVGARVGSCAFLRAQILARDANEMQARAEEAGASGHYLAALQLTMGARERARRALRLCRMEENVQELAGISLRRTDRILARLTGVVQASGNEEARRAVARSVELETQAQADFRAGDYEASLRGTQMARASAYHAARITGTRL